jgi:N-acetylmuramoyl-L-alanine amidase
MKDVRRYCANGALSRDRTLERAQHLNEKTIELDAFTASPPQRGTGPGRRSAVRPILVVLAVALLAALAIRLWPRSQYIPIGSRSEFSSAACVEYGPSAGNSGPVVFVDPGHGGPDPGVEGQTAGGLTVAEKDETLAVALNLMRRLSNAGYRVALSRVQDTSVVRETPALVSNGQYTLAGEHSDIEARIDCANASRASLLLSIHFNGYGDPSVGGTATIYDDARPFTPQNSRFATLVQSAVLNAWSRNHITIPDRGVTPDSQAGTPALTTAGAAYGHLLLLGPPAPNYLAHPSAMPGALSEPLFLTDGPEASLANSALGRNLLTSAYANAINAYFHRR